MCNLYLVAIYTDYNDRYSDISGFITETLTDLNYL